MRARYRVTVIESERGWGQRVDEERDFETLAEAQAFADRINSENNKAEVPDIYWRAGSPRLVDLDAEKR